MEKIKIDKRTTKYICTKSKKEEKGKSYGFMGKKKEKEDSE